MTADTDTLTPMPLGQRLRAELQPARLLSSLLGGALNGVIEVALATSFAALVFTGPLAPYLSRGIGMTLFSATLGIAIVSLLSSHRATLSANQDVPAAILAIAAAAVAATVAAPEVAFATVAVMIALTTLAAGIFFLLLGRFRLTTLVRFLPYPVVGGFLAGTGWLLLTGGIGMMADVHFALSDLGALVAPGRLAFWLPGLVLGALLLVFAARLRQPLFLPLAVLGSLGLFYLAAFVRGVSPGELSAAGWLLGPFPSGGLWQPVGAAELARVDWPALLRQLPNLAAGVAISAIALLLNTTGLELVLRRDFDLNREMGAAGLGNIVASLGGGFISYHALSMTVLNDRLGVTSRLGGLIVAAMAGAALLFGGAALGVFPKMIFGALLVYMGLSFLWEWVVTARRQLPRIDYAIVLGILAVIAAVGFLQGVAVGVVAAVGMFVISYSRSSVVKHELDATTFASRVTRSADSRHLLSAVGEQAYYLQLQGFIFFGTAFGLLEQVRARVRNTPTRFVVLDFHQVTGLDSTALLSFDKMRELALDQGLTLLLAGLSPALRRQFDRGGLVDALPVCFMPDLDRAAEWCEDQLCLAAAAFGERPLDDYLQAIVPGEATTRLAGYLERREIDAGAYLMRRGDEPDVVYFIEAGQVTAQLDQPDKRPMRLETMRGGRTVGELGFYLGTRRSASVVADQPTVVYVLSRATLERLEQDDPQAAYAFHRLIIHLLGERTLHLMRAVEALQS